MEVTFYLRVFHLWYRGKTMSVEETSLILFGIKEKQLFCESFFYRLFIIVRGVTVAKIPSITLSVPFFG